MTRTMLLLVFSLAGSPVFAQQRNFVEQLYGFMLGQFREVPARQLGQPVDTGAFEDGFTFETFRAEGEDSSIAVTFEYSPDLDDEIWSIEISGLSSRRAFLGVRLGESRSSAEHHLGTPQRVVPIAGGGGERWEYDSTNYVAEISPQGLLRSIKIKDESQRFFPQADPARLPKPEELYAVFKGRNRERMLPWIAPDIEIVDSVSSRTFEFSLEREVQQDASGIFGTLADPEFGVPALARAQPAVQNLLRISRLNVPMHVYHFEGNASIEEIVLRYRFGRYKVWEVRLR